MLMSTADEVVVDRFIYRRSEDLQRVVELLRPWYSQARGRAVSGMRYGDVVDEANAIAQTDE